MKNQDWVLDLRSEEVNSLDGLRLTASPVQGTANGYTLSAQRRSRGRSGLCMRIESPDGRILDMVGDDGGAQNASSPVSGLLSRIAAKALHTRSLRTPETYAATAAALDRIMSVGAHCLDQNISGADALTLVRCAAEDVTLEWLTPWREAFPNGIYEPEVTPREAVALNAAGFTPQTAVGWVQTADSTVSLPSVASLIRLHRFSDAGWKPSELSEIEEQAARASLTPYQISPAWAPVGPQRTSLALAAGLGPRETLRMIRDGQFDESAIRTLAALR